MYLKSKDSTAGCILSVSDTFDKSNITRLIGCYHIMAKNILVVYWFSGTIEDYLWSIEKEQNGLPYSGRSSVSFPNGPKCGEYTHYSNPIVWLTFGDHLLCIYRFLIVFIDTLPPLCNCPLRWHRTCGPWGMPGVWSVSMVFPSFTWLDQFLQLSGKTKHSTRFRLHNRFKTDPRPGVMRFGNMMIHGCVFILANSFRDWLYMKWWIFAITHRLSRFRHYLDAKLDLTWRELVGMRLEQRWGAGHQTTLFQYLESLICTHKEG